ncbi:MAG: type secretion system lipoprotein TssJ [Pseudomonadota bacterium]|jgi:type VI secretion system protein VasD
MPNARDDSADAEVRARLRALAAPRRRAGAALLTGLFGVTLPGLGLLGGCASRKPAAGAEEARKPLLAGLVTPDPTTLVLQVAAAADANPDARRRPSPLVMRLYELSGRAQFDTADFIALFERDRETLGAEMLGKDEWVLAPGAARTVERRLAPEARLIGLVAGYRDLERAQWRLVVPVRAGVRNAVQVRAEARALVRAGEGDGSAR